MREYEELRNASNEDKIGYRNQIKNLEEMIKESEEKIKDLNRMLDQQKAIIENSNLDWNKLDMSFRKEKEKLENKIFNLNNEVRVMRDKNQELSNKKK